MNDDKSWNQGYADGYEGLRRIAPDEVRYSFHLTDYYAGYDLGSGDRDKEVSDQ